MKKDKPGVKKYASGGKVIKTGEPAKKMTMKGAGAATKGKSFSRNG